MEKQNLRFASLAALRDTIVQWTNESHRSTLASKVPDGGSSSVACLTYVEVDRMAFFNKVKVPTAIFSPTQTKFHINL